MNRRPRFWHGVIVAAALAIMASVLVTGLALTSAVPAVIKLTAPLLGLAYIVYLFQATGARNGRVVTLTAWGLLTAVCWWLNVSLPFYLLIHAGIIWLIRSFYAYDSMVPAIIDFALSAFAVLTFSWAFMRTGSVFLATWCFFLVQAVWILIPRKISGSARNRNKKDDNRQFEHARRRADSALRQLFNQPG
ncbi:MAG TPA: hypothetical protein VJ984_04880 [Xanthomonadales bacterium]|nr:hypothetical protein [Xanthomonadales bacterium]